MPYRPDFFIPENIIGFTGDISTAPDAVSVYFESDTEFGHITQTHTEPDNIGRTAVRKKILLDVVWDRTQQYQEEFECTLYEYRRGNEMLEFRIDHRSTYEVYCFFERLTPKSGPSGGDEAQNLFWHPSRTIIDVGISELDRIVLADSIAKFPEVKPLEAADAADASRGDRGSYAIQHRIIQSS